MPDSQQAVSQSDWDAAKPVSQSDWDSAKPVGSDSTAPTSWLGHLWNIAKTAGGDVVDAGKDVFKTAEESGGDPVKFLVDMGAKAGKAQLDQFGQAWNAAKDAYRVAKGGAPFSPAVAADVSTAFGHTVAGVTPVVGPVLARVAEDVGSGDEGRQDQAVGHVLSTAAMTVAPEMAAEALPAIKATMAARQAAQAPVRISRFSADLPTAIPPSNATPYSPIDTARAAPYLAAEHAATPVSTVQHVTEAADSAISQIEDHIGQYIAANPQLRLQTDPVAAAASKMQSVRADFAALGQKELAHYPGLANPNDLTLAQADEIRDQLNAENKVALKKNQYEVASALKTDPAFAARYYAAQALRDGIYDGLEAQGIQGVRELRLDEGSLIKIRNAAQRQYFAGQRKVGGTGANGPVAQLARRTVPAATAAAGAEVAGPAGAATGDILGRTVTNAMLPGNLTRDALVEKAFNRLGLQKPPTYPSIPPTPIPAGLLTAPATPLGQVPLRPSGPSAMPSVVGGTSQPAVFGNRLQLPAGTANGELTRTTLAPSPLRTQSQMQVLEARPILVRDPKTGRFKRVYTAEPKGKQ